MNIFFDSSKSKPVVSKEEWPKTIGYEELSDLVGSDPDEENEGGYGIVGLGVKVGPVAVNFKLEEDDVFDEGGGIAFPEAAGFTVYEANSNVFFEVGAKKDTVFKLTQVDARYAYYNAKVGSAEVQIILIKV